MLQSHSFFLSLFFFFVNFSRQARNHLIGQLIWKEWILGQDLLISTKILNFSSPQKRESKKSIQRFAFKLKIYYITPFVCPQRQSLGRFHIISHHMFNFFDIIFSIVSPWGEGYLSLIKCLRIADLFSVSFSKHHVLIMLDLACKNW